MICSREECLFKMLTQLSATVSLWASGSLVSADVVAARPHVWRCRQAQNALQWRYCWSSTWDTSILSQASWRKYQNFLFEIRCQASLRLLQVSHYASSKSVLGPCWRQFPFKFPFSWHPYSFSTIQWRQPCTNLLKNNFYPSTSWPDKSI